MPTVYRGSSDGSACRVGVVVSRFSKVQMDGKPIGQVLLEGCLQRLGAAGVADEAITVAWVPGAFEIPVVAREMAEQDLCDVAIALGVVVRGETPHFDFVAGEAARGIARVSLDSGMPVIFGVLTCDTDSQALERAGGRHGHKGIEAAETALETWALLARLRAGEAAAESLPSAAQAVAPKPETSAAASEGRTR